MNHLETETEGNAEVFGDVYLLESEQSKHREKFYITLSIGTKEINFEIDSGLL